MAHLLQALLDSKVSLSSLSSALGEKSFVGIPEETSRTIKEQLAAIAPALEQLWEQKEEGVKEFSDVQSQIQKICGEIAGSLNLSDQPPAVDETDLSLKKFDEYQAHLQELQKEKKREECLQMIDKLTESKQSFQEITTLGFQKETHQIQLSSSNLAMEQLVL